ncbi:MAG: leucine-rich repeat domain-containing protein, partial [Paludibacteraceae bacterium]|nr:leucine-rich repeat domain-containing protein [Paludibacteraceae bacterium]
MNIKQVCNILLVSLFAWNILSCSSCGNTDTDSKSPTQIDIEKLQNDSIVRFIDDDEVLLRKVLMPGVWFDSHVEINGKSYDASYVIIIPKETDADFSSCCCDYEYGLDGAAIDSFVVEPGNPRYSSVDGVLFSADTSLLILAPRREKCYKVPTTTKKIEEYAFQFSNIEEIELPEGLEIIGDEAFSGCGKLKHVKLPSTVKELGEDAFGCYRTRYECVCDNSIEDVEIPKNSKLEK